MMKFDSVFGEIGDFFQSASIRILRPRAVKAMQRMLNRIEEVYMEDAPVGAGDRLGHIRDALEAKVSVEWPLIIGEVFPKESESERYSAIERGSGPHRAPIGPLKNWADVVLGADANVWGVWAKIVEEGTPRHEGMLMDIGTRLQELADAEGLHMTVEVENTIGESIVRFSL